MFRPMRRYKQEISREECLRILTEERRAVLAVQGDEGYPYAVPINYWYDEAEDAIYFHCSRQGHKLDAIRACDKVCFTVWNRGDQQEGDWSYFVTSVVIFGRAELLEDPALIAEKARSFGAKYIPTREELDEELARSLSRVQIVRIRPEHMSGKLVHEK